jgi:predicted nucleotidyltransferase
LEDIIQFVERKPTPSLLPILRSQQQADLLTWLLDHVDRESSLVDLSAQLRIPLTSVHREIERAEQAGLLTSRRVGHTRLVRANSENPFVAPLRELLVMAFGPPVRLGKVLGAIDGVKAAYIFGSWAARYLGTIGARPVGDVDVLVLGSPDRDAVYQAVGAVSPELGYPVQVTLREANWLKEGSDSFHDTVLGRPLLQIVGGEDAAINESAAATQSDAH